MQNAPASTRRRWYIMPLIILIVGGLMLVWTRYRSSQQESEIRQHVQELCQRAAAGADLIGRLNPADPFTEARTIEQLTLVCDSASNASGIEIEVLQGDAEYPSAFADQATHSAIVKVDGTARLGLRVHHAGAAADIRIVGYWLPATSP